MSNAFYPLGMRSFNNTTPQGGYKTWKGDTEYTYPKQSMPVNIRPQMNKNYSNNVTNKFGLPRPMKHYRKGRTIVNVNHPDNVWQQQNSAVMNNRSSLLISKTMDIPGGTYKTNSVSVESCKDNKSRLVSSELINKGVSMSIVPTETTTNSELCCNTSKNALKRVRGASTILNKNYYTSGQAYLQGRCETFNQKQYNFKESDGVKLPENAYLSNCYNDSGIYCKYTIYKPNNHKYAVQGAVSSSLNTRNNVVVAVQKNAASYKQSIDQQSSLLGRNPYINKMKTENCSKSEQNKNSECNGLCDPNNYCGGIINSVN